MYRVTLALCRRWSVMSFRCGESLSMFRMSRLENPRIMCCPASKARKIWVSSRASGLDAFAVVRRSLGSGPVRPAARLPASLAVARRAGRIVRSPNADWLAEFEAQIDSEVDTVTNEC